MLARRQLLGTTLVGGILGDRTSDAPSGAPDQSSQMSDRQVADIVNALRDIRSALDARQSFAEIAGVRQKQVEYLKATSKFPDFIDVGLDVWFGIYDWHIKHLQPVTLGRDGNGRYTLTLMSTQLIMRPDLVPSFISAPYDNR